MSDGTIEFWAYSCLKSESWYLGKYESGMITECEGFYGHVLPWSVQKGGEELFRRFSKELQRVDTYAKIDK